MGNLQSLTGNEAAAHALRQARPDVCAAYPITPQTELMHKFAEFVANGLVDTEMILVDSEHSAMSACVGASAAGARTVTATSANGLALMWEIVYIAASSRLPIVMPEVNRALSGPINIHCDHSDVMGMRDAGWIILFSENGQEAYDNMIQAVRMGEHADVLLPVAVCQDGFITSHGMERVEIYDDEKVKAFVGTYRPQWSLLDLRNPKTYGPLDFYDYYYEHKRQQVEAMRNAPEVIEAVGKEFGDMTGRTYEFVTGEMMDDAEVAIVAMGSTCGTAYEACRVARDNGIKAGLLKLRVFRPFPAERIAQILKNVKVVGVMDRAISFGIEGGPVYHEIRSALYDAPRPVLPFVYGLGGRDITVDQILDVYKTLADAASKGVQKREVEFIGLRD